MAKKEAAWWYILKLKMHIICDLTNRLKEAFFRKG